MSERKEEGQAKGRREVPLEEREPRALEEARGSVQEKRRRAQRGEQRQSREGRDHRELERGRRGERDLGPPPAVGEDLGQEGAEGRAALVPDVKVRREDRPARRALDLV